MKKLSRRGGFSLVELLTVIAIIAILAAIIFPVMGMVRERARQSQCMSNMKQISMALGLFKQDMRRYPQALVPVVAGQPFDTARSDAGLLSSEYVKGGFSVFRCPSSKETDKAAVVTQNRFPGGQVYRFNSYEGIVDFNGNYDQHYCVSWAENKDAVDDLPSDGRTVDQDYERQLKFRNPPDDTVVTWCSWHEVRDGGPIRGKSLVLFLGGDVVPMDAAKVNSSRWRVKQE